MIRTRFYGLLLGLLLVTPLVFAKAEEPRNSSGTNEASGLENKLESSDARQVDWTFSGAVTNESGERYHFYFQLQRRDSQYQALAVLIDDKSKELVFYEKSEEQLQVSDNKQWQIGRAFLRFNPINNSWVFGIRSKEQKGFNFKVDTLELADSTSVKKQEIRDGIELLISRTGRLNGHLQTGADSKEQFVTAPKIWFRQIWTSKPQTSEHLVTAVLCDFNEKGGLYAVNIKEEDAARASVAGWYDANSKAVRMSQFVSVKEEKDKTWKIHVALPKTTLLVMNLLPALENRYGLVAGFINKGIPGFCAISRHNIHQDVTTKEKEVLSETRIGEGL
ncbi:hypothetical protein [Legionella spiritensis]|uniref:Uncharacterized protein n=1 Tax=Legionella spiritensis TaxID=452 RepID=A0A0W0YX08_LEGSP|nr:hypothetical protein [Legionella spiritensis]KTD61401.1 hypothetical protein Lspi_2643 [Legionella spiritensis]SNV33507.1 Uncharacterised protein [Legionella spiritensis]